ncbi:uncharacterized protein LOC119069543 [Bradysia coprophila]|uniref:uncharacterized protein LOC119069543 n=1 Tax=Bradysia coprophila TaxID=38358 RepID=UPI00187D9866|nr:uncharacterized protein LOC119069543 [Bradysia coprophila]
MSINTPLNLVASNIGLPSVNLNLPSSLTSRKRKYSKMSFKVAIVVFAIALIANASTVPETETTSQQVEVQNDQRAPCGGGCVTSSQCAAYAGTTNCRCAWFGCNLYTAEADLTDVEQFDIFIKEYSGTAVLTSAEKAYRKNRTA